MGQSQMKTARTSTSQKGLLNLALSDKLTLRQNKLRQWAYLRVVQTFDIPERERGSEREEVILIQLIGVLCGI